MTASEELEFEARRVVAKLAVEFGRMCLEQGWVEDVHAERRVGREATGEKFLTWLKEKSIVRTVEELKPAIVGWVRDRKGPSCGLTGNEKDAQYSFIRDLILKHLFRALNHDMDFHRAQRLSCVWRNPPFEDSCATSASDDCRFRRLVFEYEMCGDFKRAGELYTKRLQLPQNVSNATAWYDYARFLMRTEQRHFEAEEALAYAVSLKPEGPSLEQVALWVGLLMNYSSPCSLGPNVLPSVRCAAVSAFLTDYSDKHPTEMAPWLLLFMFHALQAADAQAELETAQSSGDVLAIAEITSIHASFSALAAKYLQLARAPEHHFTGVLAVRPCSTGKKRTSVTLQLETPQAWQEEPHPVFATCASVHRLSDPADELALSFIDVMLHVGVPRFVPFLINTASEVYGFLSPSSVSSERCTLQLIKAAMLNRSWGEAIELLEKLMEQTDRLYEAHVLLGECLFRAAREEGSVAGTGKSRVLESLQTSLRFLPLDAEVPREDLLVHLRMATVHFLASEATSFSDTESMRKAMDSYQQSLVLQPTAVAWTNTGICAYKMSGQNPESRDKFLSAALRYLSEANRLDVSNPRINAWLAMCAVETGQVQVAKQTIRQVLSKDHLDNETALALAQVLLRFSDESNFSREDRGPLVRNGRYSSDAVLVLRAALAQRDSGEARLALASALAINGDIASVEEYKVAISLFHTQPERQQQVIAAARLCAKSYVENPRLSEDLEEHISLCERQATSDTVTGGSS